VIRECSIGDYLRIENGLTKKERDFSLSVIYGGMPQSTSVGKMIRRKA
jgi:hypothetical protein